MNTTKHTPGPWHVEHIDSGRILGSYATLAEADAHRSRVGQNYPGLMACRVIPQSIIDARLIAKVGI